MALLDQNLLPDQHLAQLIESFETSQLAIPQERGFAEYSSQLSHVPTFKVFSYALFKMNHLAPTMIVTWTTIPAPTPNKNMRRFCESSRNPLMK